MIVERIQQQIKNMKFKHCFFGVKEEEVYDALLDIARQYETLLLLQKTHYIALLKSKR